MGFNVEENLNTFNWFDYQEFYKGIAKKGYSTFAEVGVWKGHSIAFLANEVKNNGGGKIYAVDMWEDVYESIYTDGGLGDQIPHIYDIYKKNVENAGVRDLITDYKGISWEMADKFEDESLDFVFIDADHAYEAVKKDIKAWIPKVKKGGTISGHDYFYEDFGVKQAVDELLDDVQFTTDKIWYKEI